MSISKTSKTILIVLAIAAAIILAVIGAYNTLVKLNESADAAWAQVENQYQRRFDLIPNLVESVKGILKQEQKIFSDIAQARTQYAGAKNSAEKVAAANQVEGALVRLLMIVENYPQLKSSENVQTLMAQLEGTENRISVERGRFNEIVKSYNIKVKTFPTKLIAGWFGFSPRALFEAPAEAKTTPKVDLEIK